MKKLLFVAFIGALVACGEATTETTNVDSAAVVDSATAVMDSASAVVDSASAVVDSAKAVVDSAKAN